MNYSARKWQVERDGDTIRRWWKERYSQVEFNLDMLSEDGWIIESKDSPIAAMWLYPIKGSKVAWIGWPITNPESSRLERMIALNKVFDVVHSTASEMGYKYIWTTSGTRPIEERLVKAGYVIGDKNVNQYWKGL